MARSDPTPEPRGPLEDAWSLFDARHLPYRILMLGKMVDRLSMQHVRDLCGLSLAKWRVLVHMALMGHQSASAISAAALVDRAEVSRAVRTLELAGYLTKIDNPRNRKSSLLVLTDAGQAVYDRVHKERRAFFDGLVTDLSRDELDMLDGLLLRVARRADGMAIEGLPSASART
jgi:DNA-binding MarR family transcriptional regulator